MAKYGQPCFAFSTLLLMLLLLFINVTVCSTTTQIKKNVEKVVGVLGTQLKITCIIKSSFGEAVWKYAPTDSRISRLLISGTAVVQYFKDWGLRLEQQSANPKSFNLIIDSVQDRHAGTYICHDDIYTPGSSTELIVLKTRPTCSASVIGRQVNTGDVISAGSMVYFSCEFVYFGKMSVRMLQWRDAKGQNASNSVIVERQSDSWTTFGLGFSVVALPPSILPYMFTACMYINARANCSASVGSETYPQFFNWTSGEITVSGIYSQKNVTAANETLGIESTDSNLNVVSVFSENTLSELTITPISSHVVTSSEETRLLTPYFKWPFHSNTVSKGEIYERLQHGTTDIAVEYVGSVLTTYTWLVVGLIISCVIIFMLLIHCSYRACQNRKCAQVVPIDYNLLDRKEAHVTPSISGHFYSTQDEENPYEEVAENPYTGLLQMQLNPLYRPTFHGTPIYSGMFARREELNGIYFAGMKDISPAVSDEKIRYIYTSVPNLDRKIKIAGGEGEYLTFMSRLDIWNKTNISLSQPVAATKSNLV